jgi:hypothetical protein
MFLRPSAPAWQAVFIDFAVKLPATRRADERGHTTRARRRSGISRQTRQEIAALPTNARTYHSAEVRPSAEGADIVVHCSDPRFLPHFQDVCRSAQQMEHYALIAVPRNCSPC